MFYSKISCKDTTIYDATINGRLKSGSNVGQSEILELFHLTESRSTFGNSRILLKFDLDEISSSISSGQIPSSSVKFNLRLKNAEHYEEIPYSYDLKIFPLEASWDEGRGLSNFDEGLKDEGVSNWNQARNNQSWTTPGGDFFSNLTCSQHFEFGTEDLFVDISHIVYAWLTGNLDNNGLIIKFDDYYETGSTDFYVKKFFSRHALVPERKPRLEAVWENTIQDDRSNFSFSVSGNLLYYRFINGVPDIIEDFVHVDIINSSSVVVQTLTASMIMDGIYQISGVILQPDGVTDIFSDVWFSESGQLFSGAVRPIYSTGSVHVFEKDLVASLPNLKSEYSLGERTKIKVFVSNKDYSPAVVRSSSLISDPILLKDAYYQIENAETEEVIVPFSTGSIKYSKMSYDCEGNYFDLWTDAFPVGLFKIKVLANYNNRKYLFDENWTFKVVT